MDDDSNMQPLGQTVPQGGSGNGVVYETTNFACGIISIFWMLCVLFLTGITLVEMQKPATDAGSGLALGMALLFAWGPIIAGLIPACILLCFPYFRRFGKWTVMLCCCTVSFIGIVSYFVA